MNKPKVIRTLNGSTAKPDKYAAFGFNLSTNHDFKSYIAGYTDAIDQVYKRFDESSKTAINIHDTIVYPFCFLCRHAVELCIKYLYGKYTDVDDNEYIKFLNKNGHRLSSAWNATVPALQKLIERFPSCGFDVKWFSAFIYELDAFDGDSFKMRYPITKKLQKTNDKPVLLDMAFFKNGISELLNQFMNFDCFFDNVFVNNNNTKLFWQRFKGEYQRCHYLLNRIIDITYAATEDEKTDNQPESIDIFSMPPDTEPTYKSELECLVDDADMNQIATLIVLLYTGRDIYEKRFKLSETASDKVKDLITGLESNVSEGIDLSYDQPDTRRWEISSKLLETRPNYLYSWMTTIQAHCDELFATMSEKDEEN